MKMIKVSRSIGFALTIAAAMVCYGVYAATASADVIEQQDSILASNLDNLRPLYKNLGQTAFLTTFDTPDVTASQTASDLSKTESEIKQLQNALTKAEQDSGSYNKAPLTEITPFYNKTDASIRDLHFMIAQTREVLRSHSSLISFLKASNLVELELETQLLNVNNTADFNEYLYQGDRFVKGASKLRTVTAQLNNTDVPNVYMSYREAIQTRSEQLATSLEQLASGLDSVSDVEIYSSVSAIEDLEKRYTDIDKILRFYAGQKSPTLKEVREISDKLDLFDGSRP